MGKSAALLCIVLVVCLVACAGESEMVEEAITEVVNELITTPEGVEDLTIEMVNESKLSQNQKDQGIEELWCFYIVLNKEGVKISAVGYRTGNLWRIEYPTTDDWVRYSCARPYHNIHGLDWLLLPGDK
jgi:hypothetical protein